MSVFSDQSFDSKSYALFRPSYGSELFDFIEGYHKGEHKLAVDIGCGAGQATYPLAKYFDKVIGTDLSHTMIKTASDGVKGEFVGRVCFTQSPAEELSFLEDNSVDLITVAQCVHWFDLPKFFQEMSRVLKPKGTLAIWGYVDPVFNDPVADKMIMDFTYDDPTQLGPYWEQPGRNILRNLLKDVSAPTDLFTGLQTIEHIPELQQPSPLTIKREMPLELYGQYVKTSSSYHAWKTAHKGEKDIADIFLQRLQQTKHWTPRTTVKVEWLTVLKLARKL